MPNDKDNNLIQNPLKTENQWQEINRNLNFYKLLSLVSGCSVFVCLLITVGEAFSDPVVVLKDKAASCYVDAKRESVKLTDADIVEFIKRWIVIRYEWTTLNENQLIQNLAPYTSGGLLTKIGEQFDKGPEKEFVAKAVSQYVPVQKINVILSDSQATTSFDRILRVSGVPLIDPSQLSLTFVKGLKSRMNPHGIYVNGVTEHQSGR